MDLAGIAIRKKVVTLLAVFILLGVGVMSFSSMSRLEDPEFTIKDALVITPYPGASPEEVEQEVTDELETAIQSLGQVKRVTSKSERGLSTITVTVHDHNDKAKLPQVWDELRRKVGDTAKMLPPGAGPSTVVDDYGDVFGVLFVVYGKGFKHAELKEVTDWLRKELLLVQDVAKVSALGERREAIYVSLDRDRMASLGVSEEVVVSELRDKNLVTDTGRVRVGPQFLAISPNGEVETIDQIRGLRLRGVGDKQIFLGDVATVERGYVEPESEQVRYDGNPGIALGISTISGGNVVTMGQALEDRMWELRKEIPLGIEFGIVSLQSQSVVESIDNFIISLLEAVVIVVVVLLFFMGIRSGLLIGFILLITIVGSFIFLQKMNVALERISLGALIIALGMLVDNAIVIVDGVLVRMQNGEEPGPASSKVVKQSAWPLLAATIVAILAFAAIGTSQDSTGEFCRSLFQVIVVSLLLSWVTAVTITPLLCVMFLKVKPIGEDEDPYDTKFYRIYRGVLEKCIRFRWLTVGAVILVFFLSLKSFGYVKQSFFPPSTRAQFMVDFWLPQGTHIDQTKSAVAEIEQYLMKLESVSHVSAVVGKGNLRFLLTYAPEKTNSAYVQFFIDVDDAKKIDALLPKIEADLGELYPEALSYGSKFMLGPGSTGKVQARFSGDDPVVLRQLAAKTMDIYRGDADAKSIKTNWRQRVKVIRPQVHRDSANINGITRSAISSTIHRAFQGETVGLFRDDDLVLPIIMRSPAPARLDIASIRNLQIWSPVAGRSIPLRQVVRGFKVSFDDAIIERRDRKRTITVYCDPTDGTAVRLFKRIRHQVEAIKRPAGYVLEWGGEYEDSGNAQAALLGNLPIFIGAMVVMTIVLFNSLRQPLVIWLCVPLALIGVTVGLLATGQPFGFMALLGFLSLIGMLIKNAIVLVDQINVEIAEGQSDYSAILRSGTSRLRPVAMAAATTVLGMVPLLLDAFFASMAVTVIFGLLVATVLTMVILPVFYAIVFRVQPD